MNNHRQYNTIPTERKVFAIIMAVFLLAVIVVGVLALFGVFDKPAWEPDVYYPMANARISWDQTFHTGGWGCGT